MNYENPRFRKTRVFLATGATLLAIGCTPEGKPKNAETAQPRHTASAENAWSDPELANSAVCLGSEGAYRVRDKKIVFAQKSPQGIIICDLTGDGLTKQDNVIANTLTVANCVLDKNRTGPIFGFETRSGRRHIERMVIPVTDENCLFNVDKPIR